MGVAVGGTAVGDGVIVGEDVAVGVGDGVTVGGTAVGEDVAVGVTVSSTGEDNAGSPSSV